MNYRLFLTILGISCAVAATAGASGPSTYSFGPERGPLLVVSADEERIAEIADVLEKRPPLSRVSLVTKTGEKTALLSATDGQSAALVILPAKNGETVVSNGVRGKTSPSWLFKQVADALDGTEAPWRMAERRMPLYRLGWTEDNPRLATWLNVDIPAIQIETDGPTGNIVETLSAFISEGIPGEEDTHYLVYSFRNRYLVASETLMAIVMISASAFILFFLFIFSFLLGKKSDQHLRDLFHVWWLPFIYFIVTALSLNAGQMIVSALIRFRFGNGDAWTLIPVLAFLSKLAVSWFFITLVVSLNQLIRFPEDNFIYGYIASIVCLVNVFVFASLDFSFSVLFLTVYLISFPIYHVKKPVFQTAGIIALAIPFIPYLVAAFSGDTAQNASSLAPLYRGADLWNLRIALLLMPFQLLVSRLFHTIGIFGQRHKFYLPVNLFAVFFLAIAAGGALLFVPAWSREKPLAVTVTQTITDGASRVETSSPVRLPDILIESDAAAAALPGLGKRSEDIIDVTARSHNFLERQLVSVTVKPALPFETMELTVSGGSDVPVHDASEPFDLRSAGSVCAFTRVADSPIPWTVNFSSSPDSVLTVTVTVRSRVNPWGLRIRNENVDTDYFLEATRSVKVVHEK